MIRADVYHSDCQEFLRTLAENSIDAVVTDPPYELGFMGKKWDATGIAYSVELWREVLRVLKPGGHLLSFGGTRTYHRMAVAVEDAGFEIRDSLHWFYGTGFPKSLTANTGMPKGQGTALKPAHEPIVLARKPPIGTVAANIQAYGTGALNIDVCRLDGKPSPSRFDPSKHHADGWRMSSTGAETAARAKATGNGRWPANVLLDEDAAAELDAQTQDLKPGGRLSGKEPGSRAGKVALGDLGPRPAWEPYGDSGGASRFFYVAKPTRKERDTGCEHLQAKSGGEATDREDGSAGVQNPRAGAGRTGGAKNFHPTVKPVELMRYLVKLVTPPGGTVLDPFAGSGTTGMACIYEGLNFVGVENNPEYMPILSARLKAVADAAVTKPRFDIAIHGGANP